MKSPLVRSLLAAVLCISFALLACKRGGDPSKVEGSCDMRGSTGGSSMCIDFHTEPNDKVKAICTNGNYVLATTACDRTGALGGCQKGNLTNWYYASSKHSSADDVKRECTSGTYRAP